jgi:ornithine cyclodeaminase/alanine dehydrogenase-like protein (mu-crystallin family)
MMLLLTAADVRAAIGTGDALRTIRAAFISLASGLVISPPSFELDIPDRAGELHVKGGYLGGESFFAVKLSSGFYGNAARGLPVTNGLTVILSSETGEPVALVADQGLLTELRTAAAGALAADLLAREQVRQVTIIGAGGQARYQLAALLEVRRPSAVAVVTRRREAAAAYASEMSAAHGLPVQAADDPETAVRDADIVVTTTSARRPVLPASWVTPGTHITAVGADMPGKNEIEPLLLARAGKLVVDSVPASARSGELHHALLAGVMSEDDVYAELAAVAAGQRPGRENDTEITVCDLTGLGAQDVAISALLARRARELGLGTPLPDHRQAVPGINGQSRPGGTQSA